MPQSHQKHIRSQIQIALIKKTSTELIKKNKEGEIAEYCCWFMFLAKQFDGDQIQSESHWKQEENILE